MRGPHPKGGGAPESITGTGDDKLAALSDLAIQLERRRAVTPTAKVSSYNDLRGYGYVRVRGVNLGSARNVAGCANFAIAVAVFLACSALVVLVSAVYEAVGISPEVVRGFENVALLGLAFMFGIPIMVLLLAGPRITRWVASHADKNQPR